MSRGRPQDPNIGKWIRCEDGTPAKILQRLDGKRFHVQKLSNRIGDGGIEPGRSGSGMSDEEVEQWMSENPSLVHPDFTKTTDI